MDPTTPNSPKKHKGTPPLTPLTGMTQETAETSVAGGGSTWYSYYSKENDREYYHEPVSGVVSWVAPTCGPAVGSPAISGGEEEEEDSHHTPPPLLFEEDDSGGNNALWKHVVPPRSFQAKLAYWAAAILASNLLLMGWTHHSLGHVAPMTAETTLQHHCEPCPVAKQQDAVAVCEQQVDCQSVARDNVPCQDVPCQAVPCVPAACEPCETAAAPTTAREPSTCEPQIEYRCPERAEENEYLQQVLQGNMQAFEQVLEHIQSSAPEGLDAAATESRRYKAAGEEVLHKVCKIPLARRVVPECRDGSMAMGIDRGSGGSADRMM